MLGHRARGETPESAQTVIHDDGPGRCDIERECRRNPHQMLAACREFRGQRAPFGTEHIGRAQGVGKAREIVGLVKDSTPTRLHPLGSFRSFKLRQ